MNSEFPVTNVLIADSQFLIVEGLKSLIAENKKYSLFGVIETKFNLGRSLEEMERGILIIDFWSVDFVEFEDIKSFIRKFPSIQILILTNSINKSEFVELTKGSSLVVETLTLLYNYLVK